VGPQADAAVGHAGGPAGDVAVEPIDVDEHGGRLDPLGQGRRAGRWRG
jgi:hypothetical protein